MRSQEKIALGGERPIAGWRYLFPCADGTEWIFTVPNSLSNCIGRYSRIPEYAGQSHVLCRLPITVATDGDIDAARRP